MRDLDRRLAPPRPAGAFRSRGDSSPVSSLLRLVDDLVDLFGLSSPPGTRSAAVRRRSASAAGKPNNGSFRPPFFFPKPIRKTPGQPAPPHASGRCLRPGYPDVNA
ncbi:hypothetical protein ACVW0I_000599 [Bradyrhizobium sp. LM6.11]